MSEVGQSRHFGRRPTASGLPLETDIVRAGRHVSKVPNPEVAVPFIRGSFHVLRAAPSRGNSLNSTTSACRRTEPKGDMG